MVSDAATVPGSGPSPSQRGGGYTTRADRRPATTAKYVPSRSRSIALDVASRTAASLLGGSVIDAEQSRRNTSIISSVM